MSKKKKWDVEDINLDKVKAKEKKKAPGGWEYGNFLMSQTQASAPSFWSQAADGSVSVAVDPVTGDWVPVNR